MYKTILAFLLIALTTGCSTYSGTQSTAEMEFCWERGMNFQWIEEFDAGCVDPTAQSTATRISKIKWLEKNLGTWPNRLHINAQETYKARTVMNDSHQNLVEVRRSSGVKEWMTREKLAELNKQRALKREQSKALEKQHWNGMKV